MLALWAIAFWSAISQASPCPPAIPAGVITSREPKVVPMAIIIRACAVIASWVMPGMYWPQATNSW